MYVFQDTKCMTALLLYKYSKIINNKTCIRLPNIILKDGYNFTFTVFFEPTDRRKAIKTLNAKAAVTFGSPNFAELRAMATILEPQSNVKKTYDCNEISKLSRIVSHYFRFLIVTMGSQGVATVNNLYTNNGESITFYPVNALEQIKNVSGAGDCFASGFISGMLQGYSESKCICLGFEAAKAALLSEVTVPKDLHTIKINRR